MRLQAQHLKLGNILSKGTSEIYSYLIIIILMLFLLCY